MGMQSSAYRTSYGLLPRKTATEEEVEGAEVQVQGTARKAKAKERAKMAVKISKVAAQDAFGGDAIEDWLLVPVSLHAAFCRCAVCAAPSVFHVHRSREELRLHTVQFLH